ncbi:MAG: methyltransferase domain-containing protein [Planctomycetaceae bacterium]|nr:methyltransferase domain-containing protein [Planctomycetaceae bacterium]
MHSKKSITVWCVWCAILSGLLWLVFHNPESTAAEPDEPAVKKDATGRYEFRKDHDLNGQGKFYMGRELAQVMSFHGAPWLERAEREEEERLSTLVDLLQLKPGQAVCDLGAGSGVITLMMASRVGETGKVFAVDIQQEMLDLLADKTNRLGLKQVQLVLGTEKNPKLASASLDLLLMVDVYHEFAFPYEMMVEICKAMKPGGRVVFVEYRREDPQVPIKLVHKMSEAQVKKEMAPPEFGMKWKETIATLPRQHVIVFERLPME